MFNNAIFLNPGHAPGIDPGACCGEYTEADIVANIGSKLRTYLDIAGWKVGYLQSDNLGGDSPNYPDIIESANDFCKYYNCWALSLHLNAAPTPEGSGTEFLIYGDNDDVVSRDIAGIMADIWDNSQVILRGNQIFAPRGIKPRPDLCFLREIDYASVLMEIGFITNGGDLDICVNHQKLVVYMLLLSIIAVRYDGDLTSICEQEQAALVRACQAI